MGRTGEPRGPGEQRVTSSVFDGFLAKARSGGREAMTETSRGHCGCVERATRSRWGAGRRLLRFVGLSRTTFDPNGTWPEHVARCFQCTICAVYASWRRGGCVIGLIEKGGKVGVVVTIEPIINKDRHRIGSAGFRLVSECTAHGVSTDRLWSPRLLDAGSIRRSKTCCE